VRVPLLGLLPREHLSLAHEGAEFLGDGVRTLHHGQTSEVRACRVFIERFGEDVLNEMVGGSRFAGGDSDPRARLVAPLEDARVSPDRTGPLCPARPRCTGPRGRPAPSAYPS